MHDDSINLRSSQFSSLSVGVHPVGGVHPVCGVHPVVGILYYTADMSNLSVLYSSL